MSAVIFLVFGGGLFKANAEELRTAKEIMGDELSEIVELEDGSIIRGYRVLNRNISPFYNCDAGGFYSLEEGGFVGEDVTVDGFNLNGDLVLRGAYIGPNAKVYDHAQVFGWARIKGHAQVFGEAKVYGWSTVTDHAKVFGRSKVYGWTWVSVRAQVFDDAQVYGEARVYDSAKIGGFAEIFQKARVSGNARVAGTSKVHGKAWIDGDVYITGKSRVYGESRVSQDAKVADSVITGWVRIYGSAHIYGHMFINGTHRIERTPKLSDFSKMRGIRDPFSFGGYLANEFKDGDTEIHKPVELNQLETELRKEQECSICFMKFFDESHPQRVAQMSGCTHIYHRDCILDWLQRSNECPKCRREMEKKDQQAESDIDKFNSYHFLD